MTIENVKNQATEIIKTKTIVEKYREQVEQLKKEIEELEREVSETLDFEKDVELQEKKERLPNFEKRLRQAERKSEEELNIKGAKLIGTATRYQQKEMATDEQIEKAYQTAKNDLRTAYESIEAYELERERKAGELAEIVAKAGYTEAMKGLNLTSNNDYVPMVLSSVKSKFDLKVNNQEVQKFFDGVLNK